MKNTIILFFLLFISGCQYSVSDIDAVRILESNGYTEIKLRDKSDSLFSLCCEKRETSRGFVAKKGSKLVAGCVCQDFGGTLVIRVY